MGYEYMTYGNALVDSAYKLPYRCWSRGTYLNNQLQACVTRFGVVDRPFLCHDQHSVFSGRK